MNSEMLLLILVFLTSLSISIYSTPALIRVAILKRLMDVPTEERKIHERSVPTIGGIIIYGATVFSYTLWFRIQSGWDLLEIIISYKEFSLILAGSLMLFFVGLKDDIVGTAPVKKLFAQILVAMMLSLIANIRITNMHGIFGLHEIPFWASVFLSVFTYVVIFNAINLIDGLDGLAAGVGIIASGGFAAWFICMNDYPAASMAIALCGALFGFILFNFEPAKIFMGDSGSLIIGIFLSVLAIKLLEYPEKKLNDFWANISRPVYAISCLIYPLLDTLRIFFIRSIKGISPFAADKNHIHHHLFHKTGSHTATVIRIYAFNVFMIGVSLLNFFINEPHLGILMVVILSLIFLLLSVPIKKKIHNVP
ncbi:MAG: undecaprenyl/decaprenyl-phosphate alpha-N-acetylglucosaminyl 1-phosphate transferase [Bacteroidia bacterium]|nr:undecaprenyl/decaprenyl-phosphate alpha-N-acetylglucosaminyl 1-phosphate transferase [Bacteroidia bacterium]